MPAGTTSRQELVEQIRAAADGGPYVVEERPYGFDVTVDVVDARWYSLMRVSSLQRVFTHEVHVDDAERTIAITDIANTVEWDAGGPVGGPPILRAEGSGQRGRLHEFSFHKEFGGDADPGFDSPGRADSPYSGESAYSDYSAYSEYSAYSDYSDYSSYTFSADEGRELIRSAASHAGWSERMSRDTKFGLAIAGVTLAALLVGALVAFVIARAG